MCPGIGGHLPGDDQRLTGWVVRDATARSLEAGSEQDCSIWGDRMVPLNVDFHELYKIQQFLSRVSLDTGLQVLLEKAHFTAKYSCLGVGSAPGGCSCDPNPTPHPWGTCHSD